MTISDRKFEHVEIALNRDVCFKSKTSGFETYELIHCALPEMNYNEVSTEVEFIGKRLSFPLMISGMTGGYAGALEINRQLAEVCKAEQVALGVGSQRQILENDEHVESFRIVRELDPNGVIVGNVGAVQVARTKNISPFLNMVDLIEADAMAVHLNPLQEVLQPEGDAQFWGVLKGIERLVRGLSVPVIVKEIGCGISDRIAKQLVDIGVAYIDVAGAGGTSWAGIESYRGADRDLSHRFWDWGIPTVRCLEKADRIKGAHVIASGGIEDGVSMAKAFALGAELCGAALPLLKVLMEKKVRGLTSVLQQWREELKTVMFLTGSRLVQDLCRDGVIEKV